MDSCELVENTTRPDALLDRIDFYRLDATRVLDQSRAQDMGQVMTPSSVARFMASLFEDTQVEEIRVLDPGAGVGSLSAALVQEFCLRQRKPRLISITAYELESNLIEYLSTTFAECRDAANRVGINFYGDVRKEDFIKAGVDLVSGRFF